MIRFYWHRRLILLIQDSRIFVDDKVQQSWNEFAFVDTEDRQARSSFDKIRAYGHEEFGFGLKVLQEVCSYASQHRNIGYST